MQAENLPTALRRSSRVPAELPILVTTLAGTQFSQVCKTLVVNAHGCALEAPVRFDAGIPLRFHSNDGRETTARVVSCQPIGPDNRAWRLGAKLDQPQNFWGLSHYPEDWAPPSAVLSAGPPTALHPAKMSYQQIPTRVGQNFEAKLDLVAARLETPLRKLVAESLAPLEAQVKVLKETVARREANPSRFEVSLSSIPPELEHQLEMRLRKELGPKVLQEARQQYASLLENAKSEIDRKTIAGYKVFQQTAAEELRGVEKQAHELASKISASTDEHLRRGLQEFEKKLLDGGNSLQRLTEELLECLRNDLKEAYNHRCQELDQLRAAAAAESAQLHQATVLLESRIVKLDDSARALESGLDKRLSSLSGHVMKDTRDQLESMAAEVLDQLTSNSVKAAENLLVEANEKMTATQADILDSISESVKIQTTETLQDFERSIDELARLSVERWRLKLADSLNAVSKNLGEKFHA